MKFPNYAGRDDVDDLIASELEEAKIKTFKIPESCRKDDPEMRTIIFGELAGWGFRRAWYYWVASGPGIPPDIAEELHKEFGKEVRVNGHCMCPSPLKWHHGFAVGLYHVDTQRGLNALADILRKIYKE